MAIESPSYAPKQAAFSLTNFRQSISTRLMALALSISPIVLSACEENAKPKEVHIHHYEDAGPSSSSDLDAGSNSPAPDAQLNDADGAATDASAPQTDTGIPTADASTVDVEIDAGSTPDTGNPPVQDAGNAPDAEVNQACGDNVCDEMAGECNTCPGDCDGPNDCLPVCGDGECNPLFENSQTCPADCGPFCTEAADCDDGLDCTTDQCVDQKECISTPNDGACDDGVACTTDTCNPVNGCNSQPNPQACSDGDICTQDICDPQQGCENPAINIDDQDPCTTDSCDPVNGEQHTPVVCNNVNQSCDQQTGLCVDNPVGVQPQCAAGQIVEIETVADSNAQFNAVDSTGQQIAEAAACQNPVAANLLPANTTMRCFQTCEPNDVAVSIGNANQLVAASAPGHNMNVNINYQGPNNVFPGAGVNADLNFTPGQTYQTVAPKAGQVHLFWTK